MRRIEFLILTLTFIIGLILRLYRFDNPIADWHSWRQTDTSAVSRNFIKHGFDLLHPRFDDISNIASGKENPEGYRFVEFPIFNLFQAGFYSLIDSFKLEQWGRIVSILSSLISALFLYLLIEKNIGKTEGLFSSFFFLFLPFSVYYSRTILPDEMMVMASLVGMYFFDRWLSYDVNVRPKAEESHRVRLTMIYMLAIIFTALAFLLRPYGLFFALPMVYLAFRKFGFRFIFQWQMWLFAALSILPLVLWRMWMAQYPEGIPASGWLFNENNIRFKGAFFYWIFGERISKLILGYLGVALLILGLFKREGEKRYLLVMSFLVSSLLYLFVMAGGNVKHDYYQILIIPTVSIFLARGSTFLLSERENKLVSYIIIFSIILGMFAFSWYYVRDYFNVNNWTIVEAGQEADMILPAQAKVIAPAPIPGDTTFLYYTGRPGWPAFTRPIEELMQMGATHLVIASPTKNDFDGFGRKYQVVASSSSYLILKLQ